TGTIIGPDVTLVDPFGGVSYLPLAQTVTVAATARDGYFNGAPVTVRFTRAGTIKLAEDAVFRWPIFQAWICDNARPANGFLFYGPVVFLPFAGISEETTAEP